MEALLAVSHYIFFIASFCLVGYLDESGKIHKIFGYRYYRIWEVVLFVAVQIAPAFLPDIATLIIAVAMAAGYIGWKVGRSRSGS